VAPLVVARVEVFATILSENCGITWGQDEWEGPDLKGGPVAKASHLQVLNRERGTPIVDQPDGTGVPPPIPSPVEVGDITAEGEGGREERAGPEVVSVADLDLQHRSGTRPP